MKTVLITGATGSLGKGVINQLINKKSSLKIVALARDISKIKYLEEKGIEIRFGDYDNFNSLVEAFKNIDKLYFVSGSDIFNRAKQHENVVKAAIEAGVKSVIYTSFIRKNETNTSPISAIAEAHIKTENWIKNSGMKYTILKHNMYADFIPMFLGEKLLETNTAYLPAGNGKIGFTLRSDMAEVGAVIITTEGHENKTYEITNTKTVTISEIVTYISEITEKSIQYISPTQDEYIKTLKDAGIPMEYVSMLASFAEAFKQGEFDTSNNTIETLIGRKPISVKEFLEEVYLPNK